MPVVVKKLEEGSEKCWKITVLCLVRMRDVKS